MSNFQKYAFAVISFLFPFLVTATVHAATTPLSALQSGDLIRGETNSSVYYFGADGMRYVFPNEKIFFTWEKDFKNVKWISDAHLSRLQIGGNVTYRPGSKLIRFEGDPRVYAISKNGTLRAIRSEAIAQELYGKKWSMELDTLPPNLFRNYSLGDKINLASQYSKDAEQKEIRSIQEDKSLFAPTIVHIGDQGYLDPTIYIKSGRAVRFQNNGTIPHSATEWNHIWGSGTLHPEESFTKYFFQKGTWSYYSMYDEKSNVSGAIVVE
ncbi:MAG: hypothetical protein AAB664_01000 [Patescibacteria group bacterium]